VPDRAESADFESLEMGTGPEAEAALARLLAVAAATYERRAQLQHALESRVSIEQAKGIIAERYGLEPDEAFRHIRSAARTHRIKLHDLVARIKPGVEAPPELGEVLPDRDHV